MRKTFVELCYSVFVVACVVCASGSLLGGRQDVNMNENEGATNALSYVVRQHNNNSNNTYLTAVSNVLSAQSQVVQGIKYYFTVVMAWTNCTVSSVDQVCTVPQEPGNAQTSYTCQFTVWSRPWMNSTIVTEKCDN